VWLSRDADEDANSEDDSTDFERLEAAAAADQRNFDVDEMISVGECRRQPASRQTDTAAGN